MTEISQLRKRAEAAGCRVQVFRRKDYRIDGKRIRYALLRPSIEVWSGRPIWVQLWASNLDELRAEIERSERRAARQGGGQA